jgi:hypothetical protein
MQVLLGSTRGGSMIKVENDMLVLDNTFTKEDVKAIDEFVKINVDKERERIIKLLDELKEPDMKFYKFKTLVNIDRITALIKGENNEAA